MHSARHIFGLIGYPLGHSFSQQYLREKFAVHQVDADYKLFEIEDVSQLEKVLHDHENLIGFNVTIPHKESVMPLLDEVDLAAQKIGAVNTILVQDGHLKGFNTDYHGFSVSLEGWLGEDVKTALIMGSGGAAKAVHMALADLGIASRYVSRTPGEGMISYAGITPAMLTGTQLIVNATPLGMHPNVGECPDIPYSSLTPQHYLYDLVYNPEKTLFLKRGEDRGARIKNGLEMLHLQADHAWEIWKSYLDGTHGRS